MQYWNNYIFLKGQSKVNNPLKFHIYFHWYDIASQAIAKKVIAKRGWDPSNYVFLDHSDVRKEVNADGKAVASDTTKYMVINISSFNSESGYAGAIIESIIALHLNNN